MKKFLVFNIKKIIFLFLLLIISIPVFSKEPQRDKNKKELQFSFGIFYFTVESEEALNKFIRNISLRKIPQIDPFSWDLNLNPAQKELASKISVIYTRVENLLNMYPERLKNLNFYVASDFKFLKDLLRQSNKPKAQAFYNIEENTIYIASKKCNEYILAHEIAHAIITHYFIILPPSNVQELLAVYCDTHLKDEAVGTD